QRSADEEAAQAEAEEKIRRDDKLCSRWASLSEALEVFDGRGAIHELASRQAEIEAILGWMRELGWEPLNPEVKSLAPAWEGDGGDDQRAEQVDQGLTERDLG